MYKIREYQIIKDEDNHPGLRVKNEFEYENNCFTESIEIARLMIDLFSLHDMFVEHSYVLGFNSSNEILGIVELGMETDVQTPTPLKIMYIALLLMGANKFVLIHNHPNNINEPSIADINLGSKVKLGSELLGIVFWDQIIICEDEFCSMLTDGYM